MDQSHVFTAAAVIAAAMVVTVVIALRAPAQFGRVMRRLTLWYNIFVLAVAACLLGAAVYFALGIWRAEKHELFLPLYMTGACLFGLFAFLDLATRHKARRTNALGVSDLDRRIAGLFRETAELWRERFGAQAKAWKDVGPD